MSEVTDGELVEAIMSEVEIKEKGLKAGLSTPTPEHVIPIALDSIERSGNTKLCGARLPMTRHCRFASGTC